MEILNAISKVRFNSARPKRVQLHKSENFTCGLLCLEPGQELPGNGPCAYYVIAGNGTLKASGKAQELSMGSMAPCEAGEKHAIANTSEQRLICLAIS